MSSVTIKELLDSGVHFGHQTRRWNPKMEDFIFESRNKIHIIDVRKTIRLLNKAMDFIRDVVAEGKDILLVGTKKQSREILKEAAERTGMHYVVDRWLGGALTNFQTIRLSINRLEELEAFRKDSVVEGRSKKEIASLRREEHKLHRNLDGIRSMNELPGALIIIDIGRETNAVMEGRKLNIPIIALVDTNRDPSLVDFPIPGNDDGIRATKLIVSKLEEAILDGLEERKKMLEVKEDKESKKPGKKVSDDSKPAETGKKRAKKSELFSESDKSESAFLAPSDQEEEVPQEKADSKAESADNISSV